MTGHSLGRNKLEHLLGAAPTYCHPAPTYCHPAWSTGMLAVQTAHDSRWVHRTEPSNHQVPVSMHKPAALLPPKSCQPCSLP